MVAGEKKYDKQYRLNFKDSTWQHNNYKGQFKDNNYNNKGIILKIILNIKKKKSPQL